MGEPREDPGLVDKLVEHLKENTHLGTELGAAWRQGVQELQAAFDPSVDGSVSQPIEAGSVWSVTTYEVAKERLDDQQPAGHGVHGPDSGEQEVLDWIKEGAGGGREESAQQLQQQHEQEPPEFER